MVWVIYFIFCPERNDANVLPLWQNICSSNTLASFGRCLEASGSTSAMLQNNEKTFSVINTLRFFAWEKRNDTDTQSSPKSIRSYWFLQRRLRERGCGRCRDEWRGRPMHQDKQTKRSGQMSAWNSCLTCCSSVNISSKLNVRQQSWPVSFAAARWKI